MVNDIGVVPSEATKAQTATTAKKKITHLIFCLAKDVYATLKSFCLPDIPAERTYKENTELLKEYYQVQTSATTAAFTFRACQQKTTERLVDFSNRLKHAAVNCKFGDHLDRALKDQFVAGLSDPESKRKLLTSPNAETEKFAGVFKTAEREERAILYNRQLTTTSTPSSTANRDSSAATLINKINTCSRPRHVYQGNKSTSTAVAASGTGRGTHSSHATASSRPRRPVLSFLCSSDSHLANRCTHQGTKCRYCHEIGHLEHACLSKKKAQSQTQVHHLDEQLEFPGETSSDNSPDATMEVPLCKIHANNHKPAFSVEAEINGSPLPFRFEIDTGSAVTIITRSDFCKLGLLLAALSKPAVKLIGFSGTQIQCLRE